MTAPVAAARTTPTGNMLENGYQSLIVFALDLDVDFWEKSVTPFGYDGGDAINITTQHNEEVLTKAPNSDLYEVTDGQSVVAYDRAVLSQIRLMINVNTTITYIFPDGGSYAVFGFMKSFVPGVLERGTHPEATVVIVHTNIDPATGEEELPVISAAVGTP